MGENLYFKTVVEIHFEDEKGRVKRIKEQYLVQGISPTDVESKILKELEGDNLKVVQITETKILKVIH